MACRRRSTWPYRSRPAITGPMASTRSQKLARKTQNYCCTRRRVAQRLCGECTGRTGGASGVARRVAPPNTTRHRAPRFAPCLAPPDSVGAPAFCRSRGRNCRSRYRRLAARHRHVGADAGEVSPPVQSKVDGKTCGLNQSEAPGTKSMTVAAANIRFDSKPSQISPRSMPVVSVRAIVPTDNSATTTKIHLATLLARRLMKNHSRK